MGRYPFCDAAGLKKGPWTPEEDQKLISCIQEYGPGRWRLLPQKAGLKRCGKSCRLRWTNYLSPDIKRGDFSLWEEHIIIQLHAFLGNRWSAIARHLPKRTDNEIKNYWNTRLKKRLAIVPAATHEPKSPTLGQPAANGDSKNLTHMAQWEATRLEAERRMVMELKLHQHQPATSDSAQAQPINYKVATTSKLSLLEDALMDMPAATDFTEGFAENYVDARAMHHYQDDKVFDTADAWNILEPSDTNEGNSEDLLNYFLLNDSYGGEEGNTSYWNDLLNLANFGPSDPGFSYMKSNSMPARGLD